MRGGWFINCINGFLRANDCLCCVSSDDEGAKVIVVEVLESTAVTKGRPTNRREARALTIHNVAHVAHLWAVVSGLREMWCHPGDDFTSPGCSKDCKTEKTNPIEL